MTIPGIALSPCHVPKRALFHVYEDCYLSRVRSERVIVAAAVSILMLDGRSASSDTRREGADATSDPSL